MNNYLNFLSNLQNTNNDINKNISQGQTNLSTYPDVFYTNKIQQPCQNNVQPSLNLDKIKTLLPLLTKKGGGANISGILSAFNPQLSSVLSMFQKDKNVEVNDKAINTKNLINLEGFEEED